MFLDWDFKTIVFVLCYCQREIYSMTPSSTSCNCCAYYCMHLVMRYIVDQSFYIYYVIRDSGYWTISNIQYAVIFHLIWRLPILVFALYSHLIATTCLYCFEIDIIPTQTLDVHIIRNDFQNVQIHRAKTGKLFPDLK